MFQNLFTKNLVNSFLNHIGFDSTSLLFQTWWTSLPHGQRLHHEQRTSSTLMTSTSSTLMTSTSSTFSPRTSTWISLRTTSETRNITQDLKTKETQLRRNHHHLWSFVTKIQEIIQGYKNLVQEESTKKDGKISSEPYRWTTIFSLSQTHQLMWCNKNIFGCLKICLKLVVWVECLFVIACTLLVWIVMCVIRIIPLEIFCLF